MEPPARGFPRFAAPLPPGKRFATLTVLSKGAHLRAQWHTTALPLSTLAKAPPPQGIQNYPTPTWEVIATPGNYPPPPLGREKGRNPLLRPP